LIPSPSQRCSHRHLDSHLS